ncbi:uncharacterized protein LOC133325237 [Musca vetustissima]|uniref:uncharacterized protein LOC133325237 n=1 Tax=Musca vetustissima TaxID=27455 RepID=UPI002AB6F128|nr:uncharacterized protein LOC133325237 [Musca vetustissima]
MRTLQLSVIILVMAAVVVNAQDKWVWSKGKHQKAAGYYPSASKKVYYTEEGESENYARRDREPTTRKPLPGELPNDDIDDYADDSETPPTKQNNPYPTGGGGGGGVGPLQPGFGGGSFNRFPQFGGGSANFPGILVGPGGPTGVIGRPQTQFPQQPGFSGFPGYNTQNFVGAGNPGYNPQYLGQQQPGFAGAYPQQQFGAVAPPPPQQQYPQFTEGYGLLGYNQAPNGFGGPNPLGFNGGGFPPNYPGGNGYPNYDEYSGKSANVKASSGAAGADKKIDDKVNKNLKRL